MENICHAIHGLSAYARAETTEILIQRARWIQGFCYEQEICVADQLIGPIGLVLAGPLSAVWGADCWSSVDEASGKREARDEDAQPDLVYPTDEQWRQHVANSRWMDEHYRGWSQYLEGWMHHPVVLRVVYADAEWAGRAQAVADALGIPCEQVEWNHRLPTPIPNGSLIDERIANLKAELREIQAERQRLMDEARSDRAEAMKSYLRNIYRMDRCHAQALADCASRERHLCVLIRDLRALQHQLAAEAA